MGGTAAFGFGSALFAVLACGTVAVAQTPEARPGEVPSAAPATSASGEALSGSASDVVLLKNGGMARGTIVEMAPAGSVSLLLPNGQRREWPMTEVEYAGPYSRMPERVGQEPPRESSKEPEAREASSRTAETYTVTTGKAHLRLTSPQEDVTYYVEGAPAMGAGALVNGYARLCTAPCEVELPEGEYSFALSSGGAPPTRVKTPVRVQGMMELSATHESKNSKRKNGWVVFGLGVGLGSVLVTVGVFSEPTSHCTFGPYGGGCTRDDSKRTTLIVIGAALEAIGLAAGLPTALARDDVKIDVVMGAPVPTPRGSTSRQTNEPSGLRGWSDALSGMSVVGTF